MAAAYQPANRSGRASPAGDGILLRPRDGRGILSHAQIRLPGRGASVRAPRPPVTVFGRVLDRGVADAVCLPVGTCISRDELRGVVRAGGMEVGLPRGAERGAAAAAA